jgi:hypothetical protein
MLSLWLPTLRCFMPVRMTCSTPCNKLPRQQAELLRYPCNTCSMTVSHDRLRG